MELFKLIYNKIKKPQTVIEHAVGVALGASVLLLIPLMAKIFSKEFLWSGFDFFAAWILFFSAGLTYRLVARKMQNKMYHAAVGLAVITGLFLIWSNLAVGLIGNEDNPANGMYFGVIAIGFLGAIVVRFKPKGMMKVLLVLAVSHVLIAVIAIVLRQELAPESSLVEILSVNGFFLVLWTGSAMLFRNAAIDIENESKTMPTV